MECRFCSKPVKARQMCGQCYMRWSRDGKPELPSLPEPIATEEGYALCMNCTMPECDETRPECLVMNYHEKRVRTLLKTRKPRQVSRTLNLPLSMVTRIKHFTNWREIG